MGWRRWSSASPSSTPSAGPSFPIDNQNLTSGRTYGAELLVEWQPLEAWRLTASYSHIDMELARRART